MIEITVFLLLQKGARKRFRTRPTTQRPSISNDQEVSASVNRFKVTRNRISTKNTKNELQPGKASEDYKVPIIFPPTFVLISGDFFQNTSKIHSYVQSSGRVFYLRYAREPRSLPRAFTQPRVPAKRAVLLSLPGHFYIKTPDGFSK